MGVRMVMINQARVYSIHANKWVLQLGTIRSYKKVSHLSCIELFIHVTNYLFVLPCFNFYRRQVFFTINEISITTQVYSSRIILLCCAWIWVWLKQLFQRSNRGVTLNPSPQESLYILNWAQYYPIIPFRNSNNLSYNSLDAIYWLFFYYLQWAIEYFVPWPTMLWL